MYQLFSQDPDSPMKTINYNPFEVRKRKKTSNEQLNILEEAFEADNNPSLEVRKHLASELGMTQRAVTVWFQNRRAKLRTKQEEEVMLKVPAAQSKKLQRSHSCPDIQESFQRLQAAIMEDVNAKLEVIEKNMIKEPVVIEPVFVPSKPAAQQSYYANQSHPVSPTLPINNKGVSPQLSYLSYLDTFNMTQHFMDSVPMTPLSTSIDEFLYNACTQNQVSPQPSTLTSSSNPSALPMEDFNLDMIMLNPEEMMQTLAAYQTVPFQNN